MLIVVALLGLLGVPEQPRKVEPDNTLCVISRIGARSVLSSLEYKSGTVTASRIARLSLGEYEPSQLQSHGDYVALLTWRSRHDQKLIVFHRVNRNWRQVGTYSGAEAFGWIGPTTLAIADPKMMKAGIRTTKMGKLSVLCLYETEARDMGSYISEAEKSGLHAFWEAMIHSPGLTNPWTELLPSETEGFIFTNNAIRGIHEGSTLAACSRNGSAGVVQGTKNGSTGIAYFIGNKLVLFDPIALPKGHYFSFAATSQFFAICRDENREKKTFRIIDAATLKETGQIEAIMIG